MNSATQNLVEKIDAVCQFVERSEYKFSSGISKEHTLKALEDLKRQFKARGFVDPIEAGMLFAPSGGLEEIAIQNGWGGEFLDLAQVVERLISKSESTRRDREPVE